MQTTSSTTATAEARPASVGAGYHRRTIATNFLAMTMVSGIILVIGIFTTAYSRRVLGPSVIGQLNWNAALLAFLMLLASPGLQTVGQRDIAARPEHTASIAGLVLGLQMMFAAVAYAVVVVFALVDWRPGHAADLLLIQGLIIIVNAAGLGWVLQAHQRMVGPAIAALVLNLLQIPAVLIFVRSADDVFFFVAYTIPFALALVAYNFGYLSWRRILRFADARPRLAGTGKLLVQAWPLALSQVAVLIIYNAGALILGFTHSDAEVGFYTTAYKLMFISTVVSGAMMNAYFPVLSQVGDDPVKGERVASDFAMLMTWLGLPIGALGWACGRHVIELLFGAEFKASGPYFEWLCLAIGMTFVNIGLGTPLLAWGRQKLHFIIISIAAAVSLALNFVLIPTHGGWGAVVSFLAAEAVALVLLAVARKRMVFGRNRLLSLLGPPLICCTAVGLGIAALPDTADRYWWLEVLCGTALLGLCLLACERRLRNSAWNLVRSFGW